MDRYVPIPPGLTPKEQALAFAAVMVIAGKREYGPENLCVTCGHPRSSHLDQAIVRGGVKSSDRGWCTLPENSCIWSGCPCLEFVEPPIETPTTYIWSQANVQTVMDWIDHPEHGQSRHAEFGEGGRVSLVRSLGPSTGRVYFRDINEAARFIRDGEPDNRWRG